MGSLVPSGTAGDETKVWVLSSPDVRLGTRLGVRVRRPKLKFGVHRLHVVVFFNNIITAFGHYKRITKIRIEVQHSYMIMQKSICSFPCKSVCFQDGCSCLPFHLLVQRTSYACHRC